MDLVKEKGYKTQTMFLVADAKGKEVKWLKQRMQIIIRRS